MIFNKNKKITSEELEHELRILIEKKPQNYEEDVYRDRRIAEIRKQLNAKE